MIEKQTQSYSGEYQTIHHRLNAKLPSHPKHILQSQALAELIAALAEMSEACADLYEAAA